jgi:hypothetical protein
LKDIKFPRRPKENDSSTKKQRRGSKMTMTRGERKMRSFCLIGIKLQSHKMKKFKRSVQRWFMVKFTVLYTKDFGKKIDFMLYVCFFFLTTVKNYGSMKKASDIYILF